MSDPTVAPVVGAIAPIPSLSSGDAANVAAIADAGITAPSELGSFEPPTLEQLAADVDLLKRQMAYLRDTYVREHHFPVE